MTDLAKIQLGFTVVTDCHASISLEKAGNALQMECFYSSDFGEIISISLQTNISSSIEFFIMKRSSKLNVDFKLETFGSRHLVACENMCYSAALYLDLVPMTVLYVMYCVLHCDLAKSHQTCHFFEKIG